MLHLIRLCERYNNNDLYDMLLEIAHPGQIKDAIKKRYKAEIYYWPEGTKGCEKRIIEPVAYGLSKGNRPVVRAFQPMGDTRSERPEWKMFRLDRIRKWKPLRNNHFEEPPGPEYPEKLRAKKYNPNGDKGMSICYMNADFERKNMKNDNILKHNEKVRSRKLEDNPYYELEKNIKSKNDLIKALRVFMKRNRRFGAIKG